MATPLPGRFLLPHLVSSQRAFWGPGVGLRDSTPSLGQCPPQIPLENFGILPASRLPFTIYLQKMMSCWAWSWSLYTNGAAVMYTVAVTCVLCKRLSHDTLQTVKDALSLQLRESWQLPSPCPFELESERKGRGKGKGRPTVSSYWVLGPLVGIFIHIFSFNPRNNLRWQQLVFSFNRDPKAQSVHLTCQNLHRE